MNVAKIPTASGGGLNWASVMDKGEILPLIAGRSMHNFD